MIPISNRLGVMVAATALLGVGLAQADGVDHFEGEPSRTVAEAWDNLETGNEQLKALINGELSPVEMAEVHEVTYTLENALARLAEAHETSAVNLEEVHLASERNDTETVRANGEAYLEAISGLVQQ
ncbi:DUF6746 family protein [Spiribacter onubensis]|uniref:DUF6746 family protein n=1 Tax=Spiribacter onubensis TaxID=3122420 RepID=A0ABV3SA76_9GAMM